MGKSQVFSIYFFLISIENIYIVLNLQVKCGDLKTVDQSSPYTAGSTTPDHLIDLFRSCPTIYEFLQWKLLATVYPIILCLIYPQTI